MVSKSITKPKFTKEILVFRLTSTKQLDLTNSQVIKAQTNYVMYDEPLEKTMYPTY